LAQGVIKPHQPDGLDTPARHIITTYTIKGGIKNDKQQQQQQQQQRRRH
jgi:hypothetical protein